MVMQNLFNCIYKNKTVLITGHTGFKGSWLSFWLDKMRADVVGYSLGVQTNPSHFELLNLDVTSIIGDIRNEKQLEHTFAEYKPEIIFHLAAQPLVRLSYENPLYTYETNVIGTLKILEACRKHKVKAIVNVTSDKCYENKEWIWGYRENDPMGGYDPYSSSKACAELLTNSYRNSYFNPREYKKNHNTLLASCRAGNVIGGGDWAKDRLMTDIMLSVSQGKKVSIRNPNSTRPWQHVLESLSGYLHIGQKLLEENAGFAESWNFGPNNEESITVKEVVENIKKYWDKIDYEINPDPNQLHEANLLKLDCSKAHAKLKWNSVWNSTTTFEKTVKWYKNYYEKGEIETKENLESYITDAKKKNIEWTR
ncbi:CDP-glucose 4,6-dehydratase [Methanosarcina sp.]|uniref:CDP-glucose 4,6-dehydratase n=1 Tax=Methanosarcina sp. TaxID=2213 RepID=UPI0029893783|nr:CDP-glucose 4,6-dehydratase [Methanosarcina sp.]MDW5549195.1 CDP-glucose 4,6-dehydratase [Methanosarcina sp.]MDW5553099.1 CDP-glucose 4,6-dehydratase [Methanosarcina sp.]